MKKQLLAIFITVLTIFSITSPTPYYAPNGFPYRYNPETNTFEEINTKWGN